MNSAQSKPATIRRYNNQRLSTSSADFASRLTQRVGFTLVELLVVIAIIGILVSLLAVAIQPVLRRARETAITVEMKQIELSVENFNNKYGFYPPSFTGLNTANDLLPFLNKLSPNHRELNPLFPGGLSRLEIWWNAIGSNLRDRESLVFWLSGLSSNKQFPITGGLALIGGNAQLPVSFNADLAIVVDMAGAIQRAEGDAVDANGSPVSIERDSMFDFRGGQLVSESFDGMTGALAPLLPGIRVYNQPFGKATNDLAYTYRNAAFYDLGASNGSPGDDDSPAHPSRSGDAYYVRVAPAAGGGTTGQVFINPNTFQLVTAGLDGIVAPASVNKLPSGVVSVEDAALNNDNITNFANGRLDAFDWTEAVELGGREAQ